MGLSLSQTVRKIVLRRANIIDLYLSEKKAQAVGLYLLVDTSDVRVKLEPIDVIRRIREVEAEQVCINAARSQSTKLFGGDDWLSLDYDEMVNKDTKADVMQMALNHILPPALRTVGSGRWRPRESLLKQDTTRRNGSIINFHELCSVLRPMPRYFAMLVDGLDAASACPQ
jgi:hypothetical protein